MFPEITLLGPKVHIFLVGVVRLFSPKHKQSPHTSGNGKSPLLSTPLPVVSVFSFFPVKRIIFHCITVTVADGNIFCLLAGDQNSLLSELPIHVSTHFPTGGLNFFINVYTLVHEILTLCLSYALQYCVDLILGLLRSFTCRISSFSTEGFFLMTTKLHLVCNC